MAGRFARVRDRNQITVPSDVAGLLGVGPGDIVEFSFSSEGKVQLRPARIVTTGTTEAEAEKNLAMDDVHQGSYTTFENVDQFNQYVDDVRQGKNIEEAEKEPGEVSQAAGVHQVPLAAVPIQPGDYRRVKVWTHVEPLPQSRGGLTAEQRMEVAAIVENSMRRIFGKLAGGVNPIMRHAADSAQHSEIQPLDGSPVHGVRGQGTASTGEVERSRQKT